MAGGCCVRDGGWPSVVAVQVVATNRRELRRSRAGVVSVTERRAVSASGVDPPRAAAVNEPWW